MRRVFEPRARWGLRNNASLFTRGVRRGVALFAAAALLNLSAGASAASAVAPAPSGEVIVAAGLTLDGSPAAKGQTVFSGTIVGASEQSRPALTLGNLARLELAGETSLRLDFSASTVGGTLDAGATRIYAPRGVAASLTTADAAVVSDAASGPVLFSVRVNEEGTTLSVQTGLVEMRAGARALTAAAGQTLRAAHGSAPEPAPPQGHNLSSKKKTGLFVGIGAALAAIILVVTGREDKEEELDFGGCPIVLSPTDGPLPPCF
ncbi:MAG TPA: hypothetical protein VFZ44_06500 [Pyrinomonadaceae bacterium]